jgi:hypothetical protein
MGSIELPIDENDCEDQRGCKPPDPCQAGMRGLPTLMMVYVGELKSPKVGVVTKSQLTALIDAQL